MGKGGGIRQIDGGLLPPLSSHGLRHLPLLLGVDEVHCGVLKEDTPAAIRSGWSALSLGSGGAVEELLELYWGHSHLQSLSSHFPSAVEAADHPIVHERSLH